MSVLLKLVYDANLLRKRYLGIHQDVFGLSVGLLVRRSGKSARPDYGVQTDRLAELLLDMQSMQDQLRKLDESELRHRNGREIQTALGNYTAALEDSIGKLKCICERNWKEKQGVAEFKTYNLSRYRSDRIAYDDAIQHHKRLGIRLNQLLSSF